MWLCHPMLWGKLVVVQSWARDDIVSYDEITDLTGCMCCQYKIKYQKHYKSNEKFPSKATISGLVGFIGVVFHGCEKLHKNCYFQICPKFWKSKLWCSPCPDWSMIIIGHRGQNCLDKNRVALVSHLFLTPQLSSPLLNYTGRCSSSWQALWRSRQKEIFTSDDVEF